MRCAHYSSKDTPPRSSSRDSARAIRVLSVTPARVAIGGETTLRCELVSTAGTSQSLLIDFIMHFVKANGGWSPKVFKLMKRLLPAGETLAIEKRIPFQAVNTRTYYPGPHRLELLVNGVIVGGVEFELYSSLQP